MEVSSASSVRLVSGLQSAVESRHVIGMAQGVLAVKYGISYEAAFEVLHRYSNDFNTKLRDVATRVVETRDLPTVGSVSEARDELDPT